MRKADKKRRFLIQGTFNPGHVLPPGMPGGKGMTTKLYFSWSAENEDNWVTNSSAQPGPSYMNFGNADGAIYAAPGKGRIPLVTYANAAGTHHMAASKPSSKAWAKAHGYVPKGVLGYLDAPDPTEDLCTAHPGEKEKTPSLGVKKEAFLPREARDKLNVREKLDKWRSFRTVLQGLTTSAVTLSK